MKTPCSKTTCTDHHQKAVRFSNLLIIVLLLIDVLRNVSQEKVFEILFHIYPASFILKEDNAINI